MGWGGVSNKHCVLTFLVAIGFEMLVTLLVISLVPVSVF